MLNRIDPQIFKSIDQLTRDLANTATRASTPPPNGGQFMHQVGHTLARLQGNPTAAGSYERDAMSAARAGALSVFEPITKLKVEDSGKVSLDCIVLESELMRWISASAMPTESTQSLEVQTANKLPRAKLSKIDIPGQITKTALLKKYEHQWSTLRRDLQDALDKGLHAAAKGVGHGWWVEAAALDWARARGKLSESNVATQVVWPRTTHPKKG